MLTSSDVKKRLFAMGAHLCNIASIDRFSEAPVGYHPRDVLPGAKSVIVFARRFLAGTLACPTTVPYTIVRNRLSDLLDDIAVNYCTELEQQGVLAVPTGTIGPTEYDVKTGRHRNIISSKHAAQAAGMGVIGRNTLLITPEYGNMVWLHAIITEAELAPDPLLTNTYCAENCHICEDVCPAHATGAPELKQEDCSDYCFGGENGGEWKIKCYRCRSLCPHALGSRNRDMRR